MHNLHLGCSLPPVVAWWINGSFFFFFKKAFKGRSLSTTGFFPTDVSQSEGSKDDHDKNRERARNTGVVHRGSSVRRSQSRGYCQAVTAAGTLRLEARAAPLTAKLSVYGREGLLLRRTSLRRAGFHDAGGCIRSGNVFTCLVVGTRVLHRMDREIAKEKKGKQLRRKTMPLPSSPQNEISTDS